MDSKQALKEVANVYDKITYLLDKTGDDAEVDSQIKYEDTPDERFLEGEIYGILDKLYDLKVKMEYLMQPVKEKGILKRNCQNYYELVNEKGDVVHTYNAGSRIEVMTTFDGKSTWVLDRLEYDYDYYLYGSKEHNLESMKARIR